MILPDHLVAGRDAPALAPTMNAKPYWRDPATKVMRKTLKRPWLQRDFD
jgi:hypothetical protein